MLNITYSGVIGTVVPPFLYFLDKQASKKGVTYGSLKVRFDMSWSVIFFQKFSFGKFFLEWKCG